MRHAPASLTLHGCNKPFVSGLYLRQLVDTRSRYSTSRHQPPATSHQPPATSQSTNQRTSQPASNSILCVEKSGTSAIRSPPRIENHSHRSLPSAVPSPHPLFVSAAAVRKWQGDDGNYFSSSSFSSSGGVYVHASKCARTGLEEASCTHARTYVHAALLTCKNARPSTFCRSRHAAEFHISLQRRAPEQMRYALCGTS